MILIITPNQLRANSYVDANNSDITLNTAIQLAQDTLLRPRLGIELYNKIIESIENDNVSIEYKKLLDDYIIPTLTYYTIHTLVGTKIVRITNAGVHKDNSLQLKELQYTRDVIQGFYSSYENELQDYLIKEKFIEETPKTEARSTKTIFNPSLR